MKATAELEAILRLTRVAGLGAVGLSRISRTFDSAAAFWGAPEMWAAAELPTRVREALEQARTLSVTRELRELERSGCWVLSIFDAEYPVLLKEIHDPPPLLFGKGHPEALARECVAVVGARRATRYGAEHAFRISKRLAEAGYIIISGLAVGIDSIAHGAALEAGGTSIAVLGSGVENIYPKCNRGMAKLLTARGAIVSELRPFEEADKVNFPKRNRVISGLSRAVVILEARDDSGSLITARQGIDQGREIFVVPGPAGGTNRGGHKLLCDGASWAEDAEDVIRVLRPLSHAFGKSVEPLPEPDRTIPDDWVPIWNAIEQNPIHVDKVIERCGLRSSQVLGILLQMELQGLVRQQSGKMFLRS